jgi:hypothetical protein
MTLISKWREARILDLGPTGARGDEKKLICRSLARFGASVFFFLEKIQLRRYYSGANR